eukprot:TRINITY_DN63055_c0_g1_i1.p1 TRINITY_DN63055_c0_g1~~TRINITY_DN63055_c0_g1_i1.p1  ORF type:complete len:622 (+),score=83.30 TRINITY_DN63055_c0_g1_i1:28-1866(+)
MQNPNTPQQPQTQQSQTPTQSQSQPHTTPTSSRLNRSSSSSRTTSPARTTRTPASTRPTSTSRPHRTTSPQQSRTTTKRKTTTSLPQSVVSPTRRGGNHTGPTSAKRTTSPAAARSRFEYMQTGQDEKKATKAEKKMKAEQQQESGSNTREREERESTDTTATAISTKALQREVQQSKRRQQQLASCSTLSSSSTTTSLSSTSSLSAQPPREESPPTVASTNTQQPQPPLQQSQPTPEPTQVTTSSSTSSTKVGGGSRSGGLTYISGDETNMDKEQGQDPYSTIGDKHSQRLILAAPFDPSRWMFWLQYYQSVKGDYEAVSNMRLLVQQTTYNAFVDCKYYWSTESDGRNSNKSLNADTTTLINFKLLRGTQAKMRFATNLPPQMSYPDTHTARVCLYKGDALDVALTLKQQQHQVITVNPGNSHTPGGGYLGGAAGAEESLFRRTNLHEYLDSPEGYSLYPIQDDECIMSTAVTVIRHNENEGYGFLLVPAMMDFVTCSPINRPKLQTGADGQEVLSDDAYHTTVNKINGLFELAAYKGYDCIVFPAFGCATERNPPKQIAKIFQSCLTKYNHLHRFNVIAFVMPDDAEITAAFEPHFGKARELPVQNTHR